MKESPQHVPKYQISGKLGSNGMNAFASRSDRAQVGAPTTRTQNETKTPNIMVGQREHSFE